MYTYLAFFALWQAPAPHAIPLLDDCSGSPPVLAHLAPDARVDVRSAVSGYEKICYSITAVVDGKQLKGYVLGQELAAVAEFERRRVARDASLVLVAPAPAPEGAAKAVVPPVPLEKPHYPPFRDFAANDMKGKPVSAHSLKGKVNLIVFFTPSNAASFRELLLVTRLYGKFQKQGVDALAVSLSGNSPQFQDSIDDLKLPFHIVPNGYDVAASYGLDDQTLPRTYVLNENYEVVASALRGQGIEDLVKKMIGEK